MQSHEGFKKLASALIDSGIKSFRALILADLIDIAGE